MAVIVHASDYERFAVALRYKVFVMFASKAKRKLLPRLFKQYLIRDLCEGFLPPGIHSANPSLMSLCQQYLGYSLDTKIEPASWQEEKTMYYKKACLAFRLVERLLQHWKK